MPLLKTDMQPCTRWDRNVVFPKSYPALLNPPNTSSWTTPGPAPQFPISGTMDEEIQSATCQDDSPEPCYERRFYDLHVLQCPKKKRQMLSPSGKRWLPSTTSILGWYPKTELADDGRTTTCLGAKVEQFVLGNGLGQKPKEMENVGK